MRAGGENKRQQRNYTAIMHRTITNPRMSPFPRSLLSHPRSYDLSKIPTFHRLKFLQLAGNPRLPTLSDSVPVVNEKVVKDSDEGKKKGKKGSKKKGSKLKWETKLKWEKFPSVMWKPETREEWDDCVSEMTALCAQAALRRAIKGKDAEEAKRNPMRSSVTNKRLPFPAGKSKISPPLSELYIRERIDIDEPLRGLQVRSDLSGYLQGFVLWTTFTTWTPYYLWCSTHPQSGMNNDRKTKGKKYDVDNKIGRELELQERTGDPKGQGVVWPKLAEVRLDKERSDELITLALETKKPHTLVPSYKTRPLPNHRKNSYPSFQPFSRISDLPRGRSGLRGHSGYLRSRRPFLQHPLLLRRPPGHPLLPFLLRAVRFREGRGSGEVRPSEERSDELATQSLATKTTHTRTSAQPPPPQ